MIGTNGTSTNGSNEFSTTRLVSGILSDFQDLVGQQIALIKAECLSDWRKTKEAGFILWLSVVPLASGTILVAFMFAHLLHWLTMPAGADPASLPLWACYGIAGVVLAGAGVALFFVGWSKWQALNPLRGESLQAFEENIAWLKAAVHGENRLSGVTSGRWGVVRERNAHNS